MIYQVRKSIYFAQQLLLLHPLFQHSLLIRTSARHDFTLRVVVEADRDFALDVNGRLHALLTHALTACIDRMR